MTPVLAVMLRREALATVVLVRGVDELSQWSLRGRPDLAAVDALARLVLQARRLGCAIRVRDADPELVRLVALVGLTRELVGEPEDREEVGREEVVVPDDPVP